MALPCFYPKFTLHTLIHTSLFEILLPLIVVIPPEIDIKISLIFVVLAISPNLLWPFSQIWRFDKVEVK